VQAAINGSSEFPCATYVNDPAYDNVDAKALVDADAAADGDDKVLWVFVADATTMADPEHAVLIVDLADEPGRSFRVLPREFDEISLNLCIANLSFADFAESVGDSGTDGGAGSV
jgi:hypothetical protein